MKILSSLPAGRCCGLAVGISLALTAFTPIAFAGVIISNNFNTTGNELVPATGNPADWGVQVTSYGCTPAATVAITADGTIDVGTNTRTANTDPSAPVGIKTSAMTINANFATTPWKANLQTRLLVMGANTESAPAKLNISFDLTTNQIRPILVRIRTWNDASPGAGGNTSDKFTGEKSFTLIPVVTGVPYRYSIDLDTMVDVVLSPARPTGYDTFDLIANGTGTDGKKVQIIFGLQGSSTDTVNWPAGAAKVSVDNISLSSPRYYVSPTGTGSGADSAHPAKFNAAFIATLQPGDVVCLNGGADYTGGFYIIGVAGTPSRWITLRPTDYLNPPVLRNTDWNVISVNANVSYLDIHGITVKGYVNDAAQIAAGLTLTNAIADGQTLNTYPGHQTDPAYTVYTDSPAGSGAVNTYGGAGKFNCNGISLNGGLYGTTKTGVGQGIHHIRIANNLVYDNTAAGIGVGKGDYLYFEGNTCANNNKLSRYGGSGMGSLTPVDFDGTTGYKIFFIGNTSNTNGSNVRWGPRYSSSGPKTMTIAYSDGNGIIIDTHRQFGYVGRTLVQNNVVYDNGGSGIHDVASDHVDIVNNTAYHNSLANTAPVTVQDQVLQVNAAGLHAGSPPYGVYVDITPANPKKGGDSLNYGQIFAATQSSDIRIVNNVLWARANNLINAPAPTYLSGNVSYNNNLFGRDGGNPWDTAPYDPANVGICSTGFYSFTNWVVVSDTTPVNVFANYTAPGTATTYLHLKTTAPVSAAINAGVGVNVSGAPAVPGDDRVNVWRPKNGTGGVDLGAYEDL